MKLLQVATLFSLLLICGCQKIDNALLGGSHDSLASIEEDLQYME